MGVTIGIQFLLWTVGGLYFSWSDMDGIHGDYQRRPAPLLASDPAGWASPSVVIANLRAAGERPDSILSLRLVPVLDAVCWQVIFIEKNASNRRPRKARLAEAKTGTLRPVWSKEEAVEVAVRQFNGAPALQSAVYLDAVPPDHEYRENALPAWALTLWTTKVATILAIGYYGHFPYWVCRPFARVSHCSYLLLRPFKN